MHQNKSDIPGPGSYDLNIKRKLKKIVRK